MKTYTIDADNLVTVQTSDVWIDEGTVKFQTEQELTALAATWTVTRLAGIWNKLPQVKTVAKFTDRKTAVGRIWKAIQDVKPATRDAVPRKPKLGTRKKAAAKVKPASGETKTGAVLAALRSSNGATLKQLIALTGWQSHSVRGFLSAQVTKRMGLRVKSFKRDGERAYRIRG